MQKKKKFRKVLNIFLCVLFLIAIFSITAMASVSGFRCVVYNTDGSVLFDRIYDLESGVYTMLLSDDKIIVYTFIDGEYKLDSEYSVEYLYLYDVSSGERYYMGDYIHLSPAYTRFLQLRVFSEDSLVDYNSVGIVLSSVMEFLGNFSEIVSKNVLLLFFVIGLPVVSFGVGLLMRLKDRT